MSKCTACPLGYDTTNNNAEKGWGNPAAKLVIVLDDPGNALAEKLLIWILYKLSLSSEDVWIDYTLKCPVGNHKKADLRAYYSLCWTAQPRDEIINNQSLVVCGALSSSLVGGKNLTKVQGTRDENGVWYVYSFKFLLMNPAACLSTWRVIYKAAEEAGLKPVYNFKVENFKFPSKKV